MHQDVPTVNQYAVKLLWCQDILTVKYIKPFLPSGYASRLTVAVVIIPSGRHGVPTVITALVKVHINMSKQHV